jgi:hypothetical protein
LEESEKGGGDVQILFVWLIRSRDFWVGASKNVEVSHSQVPVSYLSLGFTTVCIDGEK